MVKPGRKKITSLNEDYVQAHHKRQEQIKRRRRGLARRLVAMAIVLVTISIAIISTLTSQASVIEDKKAEKQAVEQTLTQTHTEKNKLQSEVKKLNNLDYIGEIARRDYFLSKPGEKLFKLPSKSSSD
jgi:cell division protein DivIC